MSAQTPPPPRPARLRRIANWLAFTWTVVGIFLIPTLYLGIPNPFGHGRVHVQIDDVAIRALPRAPVDDANADDTGRSPRHAVELQISSAVDLVERFRPVSGVRMLRCVVVGNADGRTYRSVSYDLEPLVNPPRRERRATSGPAPLQYRYTAQTFLDLEARHDRNGSGTAAIRLDLRRDAFESLRCRMREMSRSGLWISTNALVITNDEVQVLLREADLR